METSREPRAGIGNEVVLLDYGRHSNLRTGATVVHADDFALAANTNTVSERNLRWQCHCELDARPLGKLRLHVEEYALGADVLCFRGNLLSPSFRVTD